MQPNSNQTSDNRNCLALFTTSPFEPFTWLSIPCTKTFSDVDIICGNRSFINPYRTNTTAQDDMKGILDANNYKCLKLGGLLMKQKCIAIIPMHANLIGTIQDNS